MDTQQHGIVAGVDGTREGDAALAFAAEEAGRRRVPLTLVHAWETYPMYEAAVLIATEDVQRAEAEVLRQTAERVAAMAPDVDLRTRLVNLRADSALVEASRSAELVVVGCHGGSSAWLGPVVGHVTARSHCPVVAVPSGSPVRHGDVVVGVDGSEVSTAAVRFAFAQAERWSSPLVAVLAVRPPFDAYLPSRDVLDQIHERGRRFLAEALAGHGERHPDVPVHSLVSLDAPLPALQQAGRDAGLVVVGSHGRGAVLRAALGSVSGSLLRAAPCPVAVVGPHVPQVPHAAVPAQGAAAPSPFVAGLL